MSRKEKDKSVQIRSSAAEYLSFVAATGDNSESVEMRYEDENIWLTQKMMATLYDVSVSTVNEHIKKIFDDSELDENSTIRKFRIVQVEGNREVGREVKHYNLQMIVAVGFKVDNERAVQFRKWANTIVKDYTIQGWAMDEERLKYGGTILTQEYFDRQLEKIREIRLSERRFYQKITDIYATSLDYDKTAKLTQELFAKVQNKLHFAVHGNTAAEVIYNRANADKEHMGLKTWSAAPQGKIQRSDIIVAKNYLSEDELSSLELIVSAYLDLAENRARRRIPMTMEDWINHLDLILQADGNELLTNAGKISAQIAEQHALCEFEKYRIIQDKLFESDYDRYMIQLETLVYNGDEVTDEIQKHETDVGPQMNM
ncbi:MAG: virulence RhuM family protein [Oscillospiraceae bacterium]|nr:virulence RhuM family protein [Oscillospiraceae bacterium]